MPNSVFRQSIIGLAVISALGLSACGGGGGNNAMTSGSITSGVITGFGSVFVNGVEYDTSSSNIVVDGIPADESALEVGMVVTLRGTVDANSTTGSALSIEYSDELEGIVQLNNYSVDGTLKIMGLTIRIDGTTVLESKVAAVSSFDTIQAGNIVEVSGYRLDDNTIQATRVEVKKASHSGEEIEVKGAISNLTATTFQIGTLTIDYSAVSSLPAGGLSDGLFVEVKSIRGIDTGNGKLIASEIELESKGKYGIDGDEGEEVELSGPIVIDTATSDFSINGTKIVVTADTEYEHGTASSIANGVQAKVEGTLNSNGELVAEEISFKEATEIELKATISAIGNGTITVMGITVKVDASTLLKDDSSNAVRYFGIDDLAVGDRVEINLYQDDATGDYMAVKLKRKNSGNDQLEGKVDGVGSGLISIGGISVDVSSINTLPSVGDKVEISGAFDTGTGKFNASSLSIDD